MLVPCSQEVIPGANIGPKFAAGCLTSGFFHEDAEGDVRSPPILLGAAPVWLSPTPGAATPTGDEEGVFGVLKPLPKPSGRQGAASSTYYFTAMQQRRLH